MVYISVGSLEALGLIVLGKIRHVVDIGAIGDPITVTLIPAQGPPVLLLIPSLSSPSALIWIPGVSPSDLLILVPVRLVVVEVASASS